MLLRSFLYFNKNTRNYFISNVILKGARSFYIGVGASYSLIVVQNNSLFNSSKPLLCTFSKWKSLYVYNHTYLMSGEPLILVPIMGLIALDSTPLTILFHWVLHSSH